MSFWKELLSGFTGKKSEQRPAPVSRATSAYPKEAAWSPASASHKPPVVDLIGMAATAAEVVRVRAEARGIDPRSIKVALREYEDNFPKLVTDLQVKSRADGLPTDLRHIVDTLNEAYVAVICEYAVPIAATAKRPRGDTQDATPSAKPKRAPAQRKAEVLKRFVAIDVETANRQRHSICQIGVVLFVDGKEVAAEKVLVDPRDDFGDVQMRIHGIQPQHVAGQPCFAEHHAWLTGWIEGHHVVSHTDFDLQAITQACALHGIPEIAYRWHDSCEAARKAWPDLPNHKLGTLAEACGIVYDAHDALADARVAGQLFYHAKVGTSIDDVRRVLGTAPAAAVRDGPLSGQCIAFTNDFTLPEAKLMQLAKTAGATVTENVGKKTTTMLVVGTRTLRPGWPEKSHNHQRAELMISEGKPVRIVNEAEFVALATAAG